MQVLEKEKKSSHEPSSAPIKIKAINVSFGYKDTEILKDINLEVREGEFLVLMGPSGSGKSTFLRLLADLEKPNSSEIIINNKNGISDIAVVFQDYSLFPWLTAEENIVLALKKRLKGKKSKKELFQLAEQYLTMVQLGHATKKYPGEMSGGMRQRAAIARALSVGSDLLLMDEPFGALDPITRIQLQELVLQINQDQKKTIIFVTHDAEEAIMLADSIVMFSPGPPGKILECIDVPFEKPINRN
ncbi:ABC transporter ATP-binding protein [Ureibacillus terrenus]|uniref:ABC transporter ATP-binding protein n=1 Tax=Ureibacillus terrenus TaxID=118246 RepID=UPI002E1DCDE9|nr:ABC transporter ATP-binding protein [Ureibacillus terrenus]